MSNKGLLNSTPNLGELKLAAAGLRESKSTLNDEECYRRLEKLELELAKVYSAPTVRP